MGKVAWLVVVVDLEVDDSRDSRDSLQFYRQINGKVNKISKRAFTHQKLSATHQNSQASL